LPGRKNESGKGNERNQSRKKRKKHGKPSIAVIVQGEMGDEDLRKYRERVLGNRERSRNSGGSVNFSGGHPVKGDLLWFKS